MNIKNIISVVLAMCGRKPETASSVDILSGYIKLLSVDEKKLNIYLSSPEEKSDIKAAKDFFVQQRLDLDLLKQGLTFLKSELNQAKGDEAWKELSVKIEQQESLSSLEILNKLVIALGLKLGEFKNDKRLSDIVKPDGKDTKKVPVKKDVVPSPSESKDEQPKEKPFLEVPKLKEKTDVESLSLEKLCQQSKGLRDKLLAEMGNQCKAVIDFVDSLIYNEVLESSLDGSSARAGFLFVGPPGVGKQTMIRETAKALGVEYKYYNAYAFQKVQKLFGDAEGAGNLHNFILNNPQGIIVLDNIENASQEVFFRLLKAWKSGKCISPMNDQVLDFTHSIIVFMTDKYPSGISDTVPINANYSKKDLLELYRNEKAEELVPVSTLARYLDERELILFNNISLGVIRQVFNRHLNTVVKKIKERYDLNLSYDERLLLLLLLSKGKFVDRDSAIENCDAFIRDEFCELVKQLESHADLLDGVKDIHLNINMNSQSTDKEIVDLFNNEHNADLLVVCSEADQESFKEFKNHNITFVSDEQALEHALKREYEMVLVDLKLGLTQAYGVSLDDAESFGVKAFDIIIDTGMPIYLLDCKGDLADTDKYHYLQKGACGYIKGADFIDLKEQMEPIALDLFLQKRIRALFRKRYTLEYNTAQIKNGTILTIEYHSLKKQQLINPLGQDILLSDAERPNTKFSDVIGAQNAKDELQYFIKYLSNPRKFIKEGGKPAKGLLLYGPPGTGKTMLARAMAGESGVNFIQTTANNFKDKWVGESEKKVRDLFALARSCAPAIIFIDEIDAIGKTRTGQDPHNESILNALLTEMDGFTIDLDNPVFVLAATNFRVDGQEGNPNRIDSALIRRFDNRIFVDLPNEKEREEYIRLMAAKNKFEEISPEIMHNIASRTVGKSLAILQNIIGLAFRNAQKANRKPNGDDLLNALEEYIYGERTDIGIEQYRATAIHEAGHAYIYYLSGNTPSYMTIESRGEFLGYMQPASNERKFVLSKDELIWDIRCDLGGRAAEIAFFGEKEALNTGASQDLRAATQTALKIICDYGMQEGNLLAISFEFIKTTPLVEKYLNSANALLQKETANTLSLIIEGRDKIQRLADELVKKFRLSGEEIEAILKD